MALSDLLWACPLCGEDRGLQPDGEACSACGTRYERGTGATIRATSPDGSEVVRSAADWVDRLPAPATLLVGEGEGEVRAARVEIRSVTAESEVFGETGYLNRVEVFGDAVPGTLRLHGDRLVVSPGSGEAAGASPEVWPLESLTAVQASSSTLQLKRRDRPLVAFHFLDDSIFLWEQLLHAALRDFYGRTGRGVILEFQPRIVAR